jgi:S-adenosylmethionine synthetase
MGSTGHEESGTHFNFTILQAVIVKVTIEYRVDRGALQPIRVHTIVISAQHSPDVGLDQVRVLVNS